MYQPAPQYAIEPEDPDARLWRVMSLAKFEYLITKGALWFCRADCFEDPLEGALPDANRALGRFFGMPYDPGSAKGMEFTGHKVRIWGQLRRWWYVNCWYRGEEPTRDMWARFGENGRGIAICSSFARLALALGATNRNVHISAVEYLDGHERPVDERILTAALIRKVRSFADEQEVRLLTNLMPLGIRANFWGPPNVVGLPVPVALRHLIRAISIGPEADSVVRDHVEMLLPWSGLTFTSPDGRSIAPAT